MGEINWFSSVLTFSLRGAEPVFRRSVPLEAIVGHGLIIEYPIVF